ncbi:hypothetical protein Tco_0483906 [Tanacetum coccineum]
MIADAFEERMPELISDSLKNILPRIIKDSFQQKEMDIAKDRLSYCGSMLDKGGEVGKVEPRTTNYGSDSGKQLIKNDEMADATNLVLDQAQREKQLNNDKMANVQEKQLSVQDSTSSEQTPPITEQGPLVSSTLVVHTLEAKDSEEETLEEEPPSKRRKFFIPNPITSSPNPLKTIMPQNITLEKFIDNLFQKNSSEYSPTLPRYDNKGKGIATEGEPMKQIMPLIEQGGSDPKMINLHQFSISGKKMTLEEAQAQLTKIKRLVDLKAEQEKTKRKQKKIEWIKLHALPSKVNSKSNDILLKNRKAKFEWIKTQAGKLGIRPPSELSAFGLSTAEKK